MFTPRLGAVWNGGLCELSREITGPWHGAGSPSPRMNFSSVFLLEFSSSCHPWWDVHQTCRDPVRNISEWRRNVEGELSVVSVAVVWKPVWGYNLSGSSSEPCGTPRLIRMDVRVLWKLLKGWGESQSFLLMHGSVDFSSLLADPYLLETVPSAFALTQVDAWLLISQYSHLLWCWSTQ